MFTLDVNVPEINVVMFAQGTCIVADIEIWHKCIGHANVQRLKLMQSRELVTGLPVFKVAEMQKICEACLSLESKQGVLFHMINMSVNMCLKLYILMCGVLLPLLPLAISSIMSYLLITTPNIHSFTLLS